MVERIDTPLAVIRSVLPSLRDARVLDVGCGEGALVAQLRAAGAEATGLDPNAEAVSRARDLVPDARFVVAGAEALPFDDRAFDAVLFVNALHHVPVGAMDTALREAARVLRPDGALVVIEPLAEGSFFGALRLVEDETVVRQAAQEALVRAAADGLLNLIRTVRYSRRETFDDVDAFLGRVIAVDPARRAAVSAQREAISGRVLAVATRTPEGKLVLDQPIKADILAADHPGFPS